MANGSFGLSGFPAAPTTTSTGGGENNALTPVTVAVNSVAGFSSGTLVYNRAGDYANPVTSTGSATFPISPTLPIYNPSTNASWIGTTTTSSSDCTVVSNNGIASGWQFADKLSNGNIVLVYENSATSVLFKIVDENYTTVVAETTTGIVQGTTRLGVTALATGGFVVYSTTSAPTFAFAIYSNTGTLVTGATTDTTYYFPTFLNVVTRSDGSWIVYGTTNGSAFVYKVYSAVGVQVYAWTVLGSTASSSQQGTVSVRSDNSFVLAYQAVTTSYITYAVRSSTNTVTVAPTAMGTKTVSGNGLTSVCLSNNDVVFSYCSALTSGNVVSMKLTSANVLSASETTVLAYNSTYWASNPATVTSLLLPSDNYLVSVYQTTSSSTLYYVPQCIVANSSMAAISGSAPIAFRHANMTLSTPYPVFVRTANYFHNFCWSAFNVSHDTGRNSCGQTILAARVAHGTYTVAPNQSSVQTLGSTASQAVTTYAPGNSNVTGAAFYAASSGTISTTIAATYGSGTTITGTQIEAYTTNGMDSCALSNGGVAILYYQASTGTAKIAIYNISMVLQTTFSFMGIYTAFAGASVAIKLTQLTNGKLAVVYPTSSSSISFNIYSSTYSLLTTVVAVTSGTFGNQTNSVGIAPLSGSRFAIGFLNGSQSPSYAVYSDTGTVLVAQTPIPGGFTSTSNVSVASSDTGFVIGHSWSTSGTYRWNSVYETTDQSNSFTVTAVYNGPTNINFYDPKPVGLPNGGTVWPVANSGTSGRSYTVPGGSNAQNGSTVMAGTEVGGASLSFGSSSYMAVGAVPAGGQVTMGIDSANKTAKWVYAPPNNTTISAVSVTLTDQFYNASSFYGGFRLVGLYGTTMVLSWINASGYPAYALMNVATLNYDVILSAGVTPSDASQTLAPSTGYYLLGVAASDCPADGTGNVTINGSATLNSSYPATATARSFDFSSPVTFGAKGTQLNRNVNLQGNV